ncbi:MAG: FxsA family protein [Pseudomonadota bacterium]
MAIFMFILFIAMPVAEIALLIEFGGWAGTWPTILLILTTAFAGSMLLRRQSLSVMARTQSALNEGRAPVDEVADGACLLVAGAFLVTPGLITDAIGFALFVPPFRRWLARSVFRYAMAKGRVHVATGGAAGATGQPGRRPTSSASASARTGSSRPSSARRGRPAVIDGDYERVDDPDSVETAPDAAPPGSPADGQSSSETPGTHADKTQRPPSGWQTVPNSGSKDGS